METTTVNSSETKQMTAIERALAAAKARKAAKSEGSETPADAKSIKAPKPKAEKPTDETRAAAKAQREAERATRAASKAIKEAEMKAAKEARAAERAAAKAAKAAATSDRKPAHMKKVERARAKLPTLAAAAESAFAEVTTNLSTAQLDALSQHLALHVRAAKTAACGTPIKLGTEVRITGGDVKFVGQVGKVVASNKLRVRVAVPGVAREVYLYACDVEPASAAAAA